MDIDELSEFTEETIVPAFERLDGVASVSASGLIEKQLEIVLNEAKIADLNSLIQEDIEKQLNEKGDALKEAQQEIAKGRETLEQESRPKKKSLIQCGLNNAIANLNSLWKKPSGSTSWHLKRRRLLLSSLVMRNNILKSSAEDLKTCPRRYSMPLWEIKKDLLSIYRTSLKWKFMRYTGFLRGFPHRY